MSFNFLLLGVFFELISDIQENDITKIRNGVLETIYKIRKNLFQESN